MGRKKAMVGGISASHESLELKPFCYYCDREFDTAKTLVQHQRTKHFNCSECGLKFDTVTGLRVHMLNAYKRTMKEVPGAIPGRENPDIVVHGMEGLPKGVLEDRQRKALAEKAEREKEKAERQAARAVERGDARGEAEEEDTPKPPEEKKAPPPAPAPEPAPPAPRQPSPPVAPGLASMPPAVAPAAPIMAPPPVLQVPAATPTPPALNVEHATPRAPPPPPVPASKPNTLPTQAMLQGLSPAVAQLLAGSETTSDPKGPSIGPGGRIVPPALAKLHPIALQVLAAAGVLMPANSGAPDAAMSLPGKPTMPELPCIGAAPTLGAGMLSTAISAGGTIGGSGVYIPSMAGGLAPAPMPWGPGSGAMGLGPSPLGTTSGGLGECPSEPDGKRLRLGVVG